MIVLNYEASYKSIRKYYNSVTTKSILKVRFCLFVTVHTHQDRAFDCRVCFRRNREPLEVFMLIIVKSIKKPSVSEEMYPAVECGV